VGRRYPARTGVTTALHLGLHPAHPHQNTEPLVTQHTVIPHGTFSVGSDRFRYAVGDRRQVRPAAITQRQRPVSQGPYLYVGERRLQFAARSALLIA